MESNLIACDKIVVAAGPHGILMQIRKRQKKKKEKDVLSQTTLLLPVGNCHHRLILLEHGALLSFSGKPH